jgi:hypothetical protein
MTFQSHEKKRGGVRRIKKEGGDGGVRREWEKGKKEREKVKKSKNELVPFSVRSTAGPGSLFPEPENDIFQHSGAIPPPWNILRPVMSSPRYGEQLGSFGISKK